MMQFIIDKIKMYDNSYTMGGKEAIEVNSKRLLNCYTTHEVE